VLQNLDSITILIERNNHNGRLIIKAPGTTSTQTNTHTHREPNVTTKIYRQHSIWWHQHCY